MKAAAWTEARTLSVIDRPDPEPKAGEVLVRIEACGICGTDLHLYRGEFPVGPGLSPGHEIAGTVVAGDGFEPGTAVAIDPMLSCLQCADCRNAQSTICQRARLSGISAQGGMQQLMTAPVANVFALPAGVDARVGSMVEPLAVAIRGVHRAALPIGGRVLILGSGTIGLVTAMLLRETQAEVAMTARYPHQRELALKVGASAVFESGSDDLKAWSRARRPDCIVETVGGTADTMSEAFRFIRPGGTILVLGVFTGKATIDGFKFVNQEINLVPSVMYGRAGSTSEFGAAVAMMGRYQADLKLLQTVQYPIDRVPEAFAAAADKSSGATKVTVLPNG